MTDTNIITPEEAADIRATNKALLDLLRAKETTIATQAAVIERLRGEAAQHIAMLDWNQDLLTAWDRERDRVLAASDKIGSWLSAALEDPSVSPLFKEAITEWLAALPERWRPWEPLPEIVAADEAARAALEQEGG